MVPLAYAARDEEQRGREVAKRVHRAILVRAEIQDTDPLAVEDRDVIAFESAQHDRRLSDGMPLVGASTTAFELASTNVGAVALVLRNQ
jgi:hypothetical protein